MSHRKYSKNLHKRASSRSRSHSEGKERKKSYNNYESKGKFGGSYQSMMDTSNRNPKEPSKTVSYS